MTRALILAVAVAVANAVSVYDVVQNEWRFFKADTRRSFRSEDEEEAGMKLFLETKDFVASHNEKFLEGAVDFEVAVNNFADRMLFSEQEAVRLQEMFTLETQQLALLNNFGQLLAAPHYPDLPDALNWVEKGAVGPVIDQKDCGSCYAITSAAAMEGQLFISYGNLKNLSAQQIIDCSKSFGNEGCNGGTFYNAFKYLKTTGLASAEEYPYESSVGSCRVQENMELSPRVKKFYYMLKGEEEQLKYFVSKFGPVAVGVNAKPRTFQLYKRGVYSDPLCDSKLVHAVLLVGYGKDERTQKDYWVIKNSWGKWWGENGYMRLARNQNNMCGIGTLAYVPKLV